MKPTLLKVSTLTLPELTLAGSMVLKWRKFNIQGKGATEKEWLRQKEQWVSKENVKKTQELKKIKPK